MYSTVLAPPSSGTFVVVFVSFQYEQLLGLFGGQGNLRKHAPQWGLFRLFEPETDAIGISSYRNPQVCFLHFYVSN